MKTDHRTKHREQEERERKTSKVCNTNTTSINNRYRDMNIVTLIVFFLFFVRLPSVFFDICFRFCRTPTSLSQNVTLNTLSHMFRFCCLCQRFAETLFWKQTRKMIFEDVPAKTLYTLLWSCCPSAYHLQTKVFISWAQSIAVLSTNLRVALIWIQGSN